MRQECLPTYLFGLVGEEREIWEVYTRALQICHIILTTIEDSLLWSRNQVGGNYSPKLVYTIIREEEDYNEPLWWHKYLWKFKFPLKTNLFLWLSIHNKFPVWDNLHKLF